MGINVLTNEMNLRRVEERENQRKKVESWYVSIPGIPASEKSIIEKSQRYQLGASLLRFFIIEMILLCAFAFFYARFDPYESISGHRLMGKKATTAVVQEDGTSVSLKDPNQGEHVIYSLNDLGLRSGVYSYGDRIHVYWDKEKGGDYHILAALPEKQAAHLEQIHFGILMSVFSAILIGGILIFLFRRRKYTGWYTQFYWRMEKFCSVYGVYSMYPGLETPDAFIAYGTEHPYSFAEEFARIQITVEEKKHKKQKNLGIILFSILLTIAIFAGAILVVSVKDNAKQEKNRVMEANFIETFQDAVCGNMEPLGSSSDYYNPGDMVEQVKGSFPGEDIYYKIMKKDDYIYISYTTAAKKNVYLERYIPVNGSIGEDATIYKLDIAMVSDAVQPDDILHNYTGVIENND